MNNYDKQRMLTARSLLKHGDYVKAHKILVTIDNPDAKRWVENIVKKYPALKKTLWQRIRNLVLASMLMALLVIVIVLAVDSNQKRANFEILQSQFALEAYCALVMRGNESDCEEWSRLKLKSNQEKIKVCRLQHDVYAHPGAFGWCID